MNPAGAPKSKVYKNGLYPLKNFPKYVGDPTKLWYRSSFEFKFCAFCDLHKSVLKWGSEIVPIKYTQPKRNENGTITGDKVHTYYPDYYVEIVDSLGKIQYYLIEVKPAKEISNEPPPLPKRKTEKSVKNYYKALLTWEKNMCKWNTAKAFCEHKGWKFALVSENDLVFLFGQIS